MGRVIAIVQARMTSRRLPGKVMRLLLGREMILHQLERIKRAKLVDEIIVATSVDPTDDILAECLEKNGQKFHRGDLNNVLSRYYHTALVLQPSSDSSIVRLTADCPLTDPAVIDAVISQHLQSKADYTSNTMKPTFPDGLDVEVCTWTALQKAHAEAKTDFEKEHVTPFFYQNPSKFHLESHLNPMGDLSTLRWTVDEPTDFALVEKIYGALYPQNPAFSTVDIMNVLRANPEWQKLNTGLIRNAGY